MSQERRVQVLEAIVANVRVRGEKVDLGPLTEKVAKLLGRYCETRGWEKADRSGRTVWRLHKREVWEPAAADPPYRIQYFANTGIEDIAEAEGRTFLAALVSVLTLD